MASPLPIDSYLEPFSRSLRDCGVVILRASPGSGKTTRVPPFLCDTDPGQIWVLEPRRLAAKMAASRVAEEKGWKVGERVGYQFRLENRTGPNTQLHFLTEGIFLRRLASNPDLTGVSTVLLDEFHERHLQTDIAIGALKALGKRRPDLKIGVLSATLDTGPLTKYLPSATVMDIEVPLHPVETRYRDPGNMPLENKVREVVREVLTEKIPGHLLVFLSGRRDIDRCNEALRKVDLPVFPLHGDLPRSQQEAALRPSRERKVILSTNIAESSLTIDGVGVVVDSGLHRRAEFNPWTGVPALATRPVSKASADQRRGRAGRQGPGVCYRLYSEGDYRGRKPEETPELLRSDLSQTVLDLMALNLWESFSWLSPPPPSSVDVALTLLRQLGAVEGEALTELGREMARLGLPPRVARLILASRDEGCVDEACALAAKIQEGSWQHTDALAQLDRLSPREQRAKSRFKQMTSVPSAKNGDIARALLKAFPDHVARRVGEVKGDFVELLFCGGGRGRTRHLPVVDRDKWFVVLEVQSQKEAKRAGSRTEVRALAPIREDWLLDGPALEEQDTVEWDGKRAIQWTRIKYGELTLMESKDRPRPSPRVRQLLYRHVLGLDTTSLADLDWHGWHEGFKKAGVAEEVELHLARLYWVGKAGLADLAPFTPSTLLQCWNEILSSVVSRPELEALPWEQALASHWLGNEAFRLAEWAPLRVALPKQKTKVHYRMDREPWIESRIQDFFSQTASPEILGGRLPLTLHLLAPNFRSVQVTRSLEGFWKDTYPEVRRELMRRYPKHDWPEDPVAATPPDRNRRRRH